ncbi:methylenetetrahydrofolate reductase C-terminal domain-containing protein [bacterium]
MIITEVKPLEDILSNLNRNFEIFIIGCSACATKCGTGGEKEVEALAGILKDRGYKIYNTLVLDTPCDERIVKKDFLKKISGRNDIQIIVCACGSGVQTISSFLTLPIINALNTMYIGSTRRIGVSNEYCQACGDCCLVEFEAHCPNTRCPKGMMNGPCGGMVNGKCEVNTENDCIWYLIYKRKGTIGHYKEQRNSSKKSLKIDK